MCHRDIALKQQICPPKRDSLKMLITCITLVVMRRRGRVITVRSMPSYYPSPHPSILYILAR